MFGFLRRNASRVREIERLLDTDIDEAAARLEAFRDRLSPAESSRLEDLVKGRWQAREHNAFLARALAEGRIGPSAALELLATYEQAGYVDAAQLQLHRRHALDAHRRELLRLLSDHEAESRDYFRLLDSYRAAGHLTADELTEFERLVELKLNPEMAASRSFAEAQVALDPELQTELFRRYLMQFPDGEDYPDAACLYLSLRIDRHWRRLSEFTSARKATLAIQELNAILRAYLPHTSDLSEFVPIDQIVADFQEHADDFKPEAYVEDRIVPEDRGRRAAVVAHEAARPASYEEDRNRVVSVGRTGRVRAVRGDLILIEHSGPLLQYTQAWGIPDLGRSVPSRIARESHFALWTQSELSLLSPRRPSPVFVAQYQAAVARLASFLQRHRADHSIRLVADSSEQAPAPDATGTTPGREGTGTP